MKYDERDKALGIFKYFAATVYGDEPAMWLQENWEYIEPWHMKLIEALKNYPTKVNQNKVLQFSLCVTSTDLPLFIEYVNSFSKYPASALVTESLQASRGQQKLSFEVFLQLTDTIMMDKYQTTIERCRGELMQTPMVGWVEFL
jgi:hypothetical protein